jgi:hypothetical protein
MSVGVVSSKPVIRNFDPRSIPRCSLWFDAADSSTITLSSGSNVGQWASKGNVAVNLSQITTSNQPVYTSLGGISGIQFLGTRQCFMRTPTTLSGYHLFDLLAQGNNGSNYTFFAVVTLSQPTTPCNVLVGQRSSDNNVFLRYTALSSNNFTYVAGGTAGGTLLSMTTTNMVYNTPTVLTLQVSGIGAIRNCLINGIKQTTSDTATPANLNSTINSTYFLLLGDNTAGSNLSGNVHELLLYNTCLPNAARSIVESYLTWKWNSINNVGAPLTVFRSSPRQTLLSNYSYVPTTPLWWFDALDQRSITLSNIFLQQWTSKLSSSVTCTPSLTIGTPPEFSTFLNGLPGMIFDSNSSNCIFMNNPVTFQNNFLTQIFVLELPSSGGADERFLNNQGSNATAFRVFRRSGSNLQVIMQAPVTGGQNTFTLNSNYYNRPIVVSITETNNQSNLYPNEIYNLYVNGNLQVISPQPRSDLVSTLSSFVFGCQFVPFVSTGSGSLFANCVLGEWIGFSPPLTRGQREIVEGYLAAKWGITISSGNSYNSTAAGLASNTTFCPHPYFRRTGAPIPMLAPTLFSPDGFDNLVLWLDAADFSTISRDSNSLVVQWRDKSICGNHINATSGTNPTYIEKGALGNLPLLRGLSGTSISAISNTGNSFFVVNQYTPTLGDGSSTFRTNTESLTISISGSVGQFTVSTAIGSLTFNNTSNIPTLHEFIRQTVGWAYYVNASLIGSVGLTTTASSNSFRFSNGTGQLDYGEVVVYSGAPTTWVRSQIEGYLAWKWNLRGYLPSNHPFYLAPP